MLDQGDQAPDFTLTTGDGETVSLAALRGTKVVLYFYPRDDTPGCTAEACTFRDMSAEFEARGAKVFGVSADSEKSHVKFATKYQLNFPLLSDHDHAVATAYESYGPKKFMGKSYEGIIRNTFLIDEDGKIARAWRSVRPKEHVEEVLAAL